MMVFDQATYEDQVFHEVDLTEGTVADVSFSGCRFEEVTLTSTQLLRCTFQSCVFENCDLSMASVKGCVFRGVTFQRCRLVGVNFAVAEWPKADQPRLHHPVDFAGCALNYANFYGVALGDIMMKDCVAHEADFTQANLKGATLSGTDFERSIFYETDLSKADLRGARNYLISPSENTIKKAKFALPEAMGLLYSMDIEIDDGRDAE